MLNGGEIIVEYLAREKVPYVFGLCGHGNVGLLDALYDRTDAIKTISTRHEQTAGHMADAYFRVAHHPVATLTSCGPGSANIPIALACAFMDSSALLAITAGPARGLIDCASILCNPYDSSYIQGTDGQRTRRGHHPHHRGECMERSGIRGLIGRAMIDKDFLDELVRDPVSVLAGFDLSAEEHAAVMKAVGSTDGASERERSRALQEVMMKRWAT